MSAALRVDLSVPLHEFDLRVAFEARTGTLGIFGRSGAGKTTLLETIAGLRRGASGTISLDAEAWLDSAGGVDRPAERRGVGYVPQDALLFPHWDVRGNVLAGRGRAAGARGAPLDPDQVLEVLDLRSLVERRVSTLSGGERQRVALARALCSAPSLLLMDEPLASIEASLRGRILHYLLAVRDAFRIPTLYVSHEATEVTILCDEVVVIDRGSLQARGRPAHVFAEGAAASWLPEGSFENVLEGRIAETSAGTATVEIGEAGRVVVSADGVAPGTQVLVGIRAVDFMIATGDPEGLSARTVLPGVIREVRSAGGGHLISVGIGSRGPEVAVLVTEAARATLGLAPGRPVRLVAKARACRLLALR